VRGARIRAVEVGSRRGDQPTLVVGCIHGDECAGGAVAADLATDGPVRGVDLWVLPDLNPDGRAANTRQNAHGVDLNRNFAWRWHAAAVGDQYPGQRPFSEPETRFARSLILKLRPELTIWFHQPLALVDRSGGSATIEQRFARLVRMPVRRLIRYPGSATTWQNHVFSTATAFVVELPLGRLSPRLTERFADAIVTLSRGA